jgi:hypothetical protein
MDTLIKGFGLGITLVILALNSGCGKAPEMGTAAVPATIVNTNQTSIKLFAVPVGDESGGTYYTFTKAVKVTIPSSVFRVQGTVDQDGRGVGIDFGDPGQCYYDASQSNPGVYVFNTCTNNMHPGQQVPRKIGDTVIFWAYIHVNSNDSVANWIAEAQ